MEITETIQKIVAENEINSLRFHAVSKLNERGILHKIVDGFANKTKHWQQTLDIANMGCYKMSLKKGMFTPKIDDWQPHILEIVPRQEEMVYLIFTEHKPNNKVKFHIYEGFLKQIIKVLLEYKDAKDYYLVSKNYEWLISLNRDGKVYCVGDVLENNYNEFVKKRTTVFSNFETFR